MPDDPKEHVAELLATSSLSMVSDEQALRMTGNLIDLAEDLKHREALQTALAWCEELHRRALSPNARATLHYFQANAISATRRLALDKDESTWEQQGIEDEITHLRQALRIGDETNLDTHRLSQILTNLGNLLSNRGRIAEAIEYWDRAMSFDPPHGMAVGNRGYGLLQYAQVLHQPGHQLALLREAHKCLSAAIAAPLHRGAYETFNAAKDWIQEHVPKPLLEQPARAVARAPGRSRVERAYRAWSDRHRLFLCSLNDLGVERSSYRDCAFLPGIQQSLGAGPYYLGFFNQIKQEFVAARLLYYEGITRYKIHFADRFVRLADTLDYSVYSIAVERVKAAFRMTYSLFDKIAFFLNDYLALGISDKRVSFKTLWYEEPLSERRPRPSARRAQNQPLLGLFWVAKDLQETEAGFTEAMEPDLQHLAEVRNHLEHRYLKLHMEHWIPANDPSSRAQLDTLAYHIDRASFEAKTLKLLKLARASLIYLSAAVYVEESHRDRARPRHEQVFPMELPEIRDEWKL